MKNSDLKFVNEVIGGKSYLIFQQENMFYIFAAKEYKGRGNFVAVSHDEVESVKKELADKKISETFHPDVVYKDIEIIASSEDLEKKDPRYAISHLRNICYILVAQGFLTSVKEKSSVFFTKTPELTKADELAMEKIIDELYQKALSHPKTPEKKDMDMIRCAICNKRVKKKNLRKHVRRIHMKNNEEESNE